MGAYAVREIRHRDRREPRGQGRERSAGRCRHLGCRCRRNRARAFQRRLLAAGFYRLIGAAGRSATALQAGDAGRERLRDGLCGGASGRARDRGGGCENRAGGRRRADDAHAGTRDRPQPAARVVSAGGWRHPRRLCRRVRQDRAGLFPEIRRPVRCAGDDRRKKPQERRRQSLCADAQGFWL